MFKLKNILVRRILVIFGSILLFTNILFSQGKTPDESVTEPDIHPSLMWTVAQFIPSPEWVTSSDGMTLLAASSGEFNPMRLKYMFNENFIYYGGITTDKTAYNTDSHNPFVLSTWILFKFALVQNLNFII